jgi:hypothetical protein
MYHKSTGNESSTIGHTEELGIHRAGEMKCHFVSKWTPFFVDRQNPDLSTFTGNFGASSSLAEIRSNRSRSDRIQLEAILPRSDSLSQFSVNSQKPEADELESTELASTAFVRRGMYQTSSQRAGVYQKMNRSCSNKNFQRGGNYFPVSHSFTRNLTNNHMSKALVHGGSLMFRDEGMQLSRDRHAALPNPSSWE